MKEKDFDFEQVGKRMPYRLDKDALDRVTRNVLDVCENDTRKSNVYKLRSRRRYLYSALGAVAAVLFLFVYIGIGHQEPSNQIRMSNIYSSDSLQPFLVTPEQYAENISDTAFPKDLSAGVFSYPEKEIKAMNSSVSSLPENKLPTDRLIDELSDEDLLFLTEITGGTVADQWYN